MTLTLALLIILAVAFVVWLISQARSSKLPGWVGTASFFTMVVCLVLLVILFFTGNHINIDT